MRKCSSDPGSGSHASRDGLIPRVERSGRGAARDPAAPVFHRPVDGFDGHLRRVVRQVEQRARGPDRDRIPGIEAEEVHAGTAVHPHIRPDVELGKRRDPWQRRDSTRRDIRHMERHDAEPRLRVVEVELKTGRDERAECRHVERPVREEQVVPGLRHDPRRIGHRPRPVPGDLQNPVVEIVLQERRHPVTHSTSKEAASH